MALISNAKGRGENETPSGYERLFGNRQLGMLFSKVHATVITSGNELEKFLANRLTKTEGVSIDMINKEKRVLKDAKTDSSGKKHKLDIDCVIERDGKMILIEIKDGDTFDTKKTAGEIQSLIMAKNYLMKEKGLREEDIEIKFCSFNARDHQQIERGAKGLLPEDYALTGEELCELLDLDFDKLVEERKEHQGENLHFFIMELKKIPEVAEELSKEN